MSVCLAAAGIVKALAVTSFTLAWTHSVQKTEWQEDWRVTPAGLELTEARVKGSGAGMEPPPEAKLIDGWYRWKPDRGPLREVVLGDSGAAGSWRFCESGPCRTISEIVGDAARASPVTMSACAARPG